MTDLTKTTTAPEPGLIPLPAAAARALTLVGGIATAASAFLAWTWTSEFPGDLTITGYPGGLQWLTFTGGLLITLFALAGYGIRGLGWLLPAGNNGPTVLTALGTFGTTWFTVIAIAVNLDGLVNLEPGAYVAAVASSSRSSAPSHSPPQPTRPATPRRPTPRACARAASPPRAG